MWFGKLLRVNLDGILHYCLAVGYVGVEVVVRGVPPPVSPLKIVVYHYSNRGVNDTTEIFLEKK
jgi:hypothetical protein